MVYWLIDLSIFRNKVYLQIFLAHVNDKVVTRELSKLAIINDILDCGKFANNTYPQP